MKYPTPQTTPGQATFEGDEQFVRMNAKLDPSALSAGEYALAINKRVNRGVAETRNGTVTPAWANYVSMASGILGSGSFNNPNSEEQVILIALPGSVLMIRPGAAATTVPLPTGVTLSGTITFSQQFDKVLLHRGTSDSPLVWDGIDSGGFVVVTMSDPTNTARSVLPNVDWSVNMGGRAIFPVSRDEIGVSDALDYSMYDPIFGVFRVNAGTADPIVGAYPFARSNVLIGKRRSWDVLANFIGDITNSESTAYQNVSMQVLSSTVGIAARRSFAMVGGDALFLADSPIIGVYNISEVVQERLQTGDVPISDPIQPIMDRINTAAIDGAVACVLGPYYFLAVPLDGATANNTVLVYNTVTKGWDGYDTWHASFGMQIDDLLVMNYLGLPAVYAVNKSLDKIHVLYASGARADDKGSAEYEISDRLDTRGYSTLGWNAGSKRDFRRLELVIRTWRPSVTVTAVFEDAGDTRALTASAVTKDRTKYFRFGVADFVATNVNGDFATAGREDYSIAPGSTGIYPGTNGITPMTKQESTLRFSPTMRGRTLSLRIENAQGACDVVSVAPIESNSVGRTIRRAA